MRTVKEISKITGISVRTLHYYDEIGLLKPTACSGAGYRLYDDKALEDLQQILFFREFDIPLKEIKGIMEHPSLDRNQILYSQKRMLELKKERLERLISSIDGILKGEDKMDFKVFDKSEIETMYRAMIEKMNPDQIQTITEKYGSVENFERHFMEQAAGQQTQENFAKLVEWYGDKERVIDAAKKTASSQIIESYQKRVDEIYRRLGEKREIDPRTFEVKQLIGEYDFITKQMYQMEDVKKLVLDLASLYRCDERIKTSMDEQYGEGTSEYIAKAIEVFYEK